MHEDWVELANACKMHSPLLKQKDIIIMRLYLTFMGLDIADEKEDRKFLDECGSFLRDCGSSVLDMM